MDTRKVTLVATILAIALVAVGIGYAYTAITTNSGNNTDVQYIALKQGGTGQYQFSANDHIIWNSNDYRTGAGTLEDQYVYHTDYTINSPSVIPYEEDYVVKQIGNPFTIDASAQANAVTTDLTAILWTNNFSTSITSDGNTVTGSIVFIIKVVNGETPYSFKVDNEGIKIWNGTTWDNTAANIKFTITAIDTDDEDEEKDAYAETTVTVYCGYTATQGKIAVTNTDNDPRPITSTPLVDASLFFRADTESVAIPVTGVSIVGDETRTVTIGTPLQLSATLTPAVPTQSGVYWTSSNNSIATVSSSGLVTGVTVGEDVVITVTTVDGSYTDSITVSVVAAP